MNKLFNFLVGFGIGLTVVVMLSAMVAFVVWKPLSDILGLFRFAIAMGIAIGLIGMGLGEIVS